MILSKRMPRFESEHDERRHACSVLLPHAMIVVSYETKRLDCRSLLLLNMSRYEVELGRYQDSHQHAVQSYEASLETHGDLSLETLERKFQIAKTLLNIGESDESTNFMDKFSKGLEDLRKANNELDAAFTSTPDFKILEQEDPGLAAIQQAFDLDQAYSGTPSAIRTLSILAKAAQREGKCEKSECLYRQTLRKSTEFFGENHPETFKYMNELGHFLSQKEITAEAVQLYRQAIRGRQSIYGMEHPLTMESYKELASALYYEGNLVEAEVLGRRVVDYSLRIFGIKSQRTSSAMVLLTEIVEELGKLDEAEELTYMASIHLEDITADVTSTFSSSYLARDNPFEAEQILRKGVEILRGRGGQEQPESLLLWKQLARCLEKQEKWEAAEGYWRRILEVYEHLDGDNYVSALKHYLRLSRTLLKQRKCLTALLVIQDILEKMKRHHPDETVHIQDLEKNYDKAILCAFNQINELEMDERRTAENARPTPLIDDE